MSAYGMNACMLDSIVPHPSTISLFLSFYPSLCLLCEETFVPLCLLLYLAFVGTHQCVAGLKEHLEEVEEEEEKASS